MLPLSYMRPACICAHCIVPESPDRTSLLSTGLLLPPPPLALSRIMAGPRTCIPNNEDNDKSTRRIRPRMCAEYPMHNIASLSSVSPLSLLLLHPVHAWISDSTLPRSNYDRARPSPPFPPSLLPRHCSAQVSNIIERDVEGRGLRSFSPRLYSHCRFSSAGVYRM